MAKPALDKILGELDVLVQEELRLVSYKWLARRFSIPSNYAKQVLFKYAESKRENVSTAYLVAGWSRQDGKEHLIQLVDGSNLPKLQQQLNPVTSIHVYSVSPAALQNPADVYQYDYQQSQELAAALLSKTETPGLECLRRNTCSAVRFAALPRDVQSLNAAAKAVFTAKHEAAEASAPGSKVNKNPSATSAPGSSGVQSPPAAAAQPPLTDGRQTTAPKAGAAAAPPAGSKPKGAIASMWSKAPAKAPAKAATVKKNGTAAAAAQSAPAAGKLRAILLTLG